MLLMLPALLWTGTSFLTIIDWMCPAQVLTVLAWAGEGLWKESRPWKDSPLNEHSSKTLKARVSATNMERHKREAGHWWDISASKLKVWPYLKFDVLASKCVNSRRQLRPFASGVSYSYSGWLPSRKTLRCPWMLKFIPHNRWAGIHCDLFWSSLAAARAAMDQTEPGPTSCKWFQSLQPF